MKKIPISNYEIISRSGYHNYEYTWYTYLPRNLTLEEELKFKNDYLKMHDLLEDVDTEYHCNPRYAIHELNLYQLDTPAKIAIARDYFNLDFYRTFLEDEIDDEKYLAEDLMTLINHKIFPETKHYETIKKIIQNSTVAEFDYLKEWIHKKEILG